MEIKFDTNLLEFEDDNGIKTHDLFILQSDLHFFSDMILNTSYSVYALTGTWGSGKSSFIKMFKNIAEKNEKNCIYINAFENDYQTEPFNMIIKSMAQFLNKDDFDGKKDFFENAKQIAFRTGKAGVKIGLNLLLKKLFGSDSEDFKELLTCVTSDFVDEFDYEKSEEEDIYAKFKTATEKLIKEKGEVIIIIDELDRCRPDFALETIEKIKHIFNTQGLKFILVYNEEIINAIIGKTYGIKNDVDRYMNKFIDRKYTLPEKQTYTLWLQDRIKKLKEKGLNENINTIFMYRANDFNEIMRKYKITPRDMERIICNSPYINSLNNNYAPRDNSYMAVMCVVFELYKHLDPVISRELFEYMKNKENKLSNFGNDISKFFDLESKILNSEPEKLEPTLRNYVNWKGVY